MNEKKNATRLKALTLHQEDFIDARVQRACRIGFVLIGIAILVYSYSRQTSQPILHGNAEETQASQESLPAPAGKRHDFRTLTPPPPVPTPPQDKSTVPSPTPPDQAVQTDQSSSRRLEPEISSEFTENQRKDSESPPQPDELAEQPLVQTAQSNPAHESMNETSPPEQAISTPAFQIIAGQNAPHFMFESLEAMKQAARDHGCRFVITDGSFSLEIGRDLDNLSTIRSISADWHLLYARRMVRLPMNEQVNRAIDAGCRRYSQLDRNQARVYLSVPHSLDQAIFAAQLQYQPSVSVQDTTVIRVSFGGRCQVCQVLSVESKGER
jgi:hypothetical protein